MGKSVVSVTVDSHIEEYTEELEEKIEDWLKAVGEDAASTAAEIPNFPVDTGRLRNSITCATQTYQSPANQYEGANAKPKDYKKHAEPEKHSVYIGTNVEYAVYHEVGTSRGIPARHFIQFGMTAHKEKYKQMLEEKLKGD